MPTVTLDTNGRTKISTTTVVTGNVTQRSGYTMQESTASTNIGGETVSCRKYKLGT